MNLFHFSNVTTFKRCWNFKTGCHKVISYQAPTSRGQWRW